MYLVWLGIVGCGRGPELGKYMLIHAALQGKTGTNYISTSMDMGAFRHMYQHQSASISIDKYQSAPINDNVSIKKKIYICVYWHKCSKLYY